MPAFYVKYCGCKGEYSQLVDAPPRRTSMLYAHLNNIKHA
jgi:hypothetical protein